MRFNFRIKIRGWTLFGMLAKTQTMLGFTSLIKNVKNVWENKHIVMWDIEGAKFSNTVLNLTFIQKAFDLGKIFIVGESISRKSYRAWCFKPVTFRELISIINSTPNIDYLFLKYTILRGKATLRISKKKDRPKQRILHIIEGKDYPIPKRMEKVIYDTGIVKDAKQINFEV